MFTGKDRRLFKFPTVLLWIPSAANFYVAALVFRFAWNRSNEIFEAQADFEVAMRIAAVSLPIACVMLGGFLFWVAMGWRFRRGLIFNFYAGPFIVFTLNIAAPVIFWYALKWSI